MHSSENEGFLSGTKSPAYLKRRRMVLIGIVIVVVVATALTITAFAVFNNGKPATPIVPLEDLITVTNLMQHLYDLQHVADSNNGTRAAGTSGYEQSVNYVKATLESAGYDVVLQPFEFAHMNILEPPVLYQISPLHAFKYGTDFAIMGSYAGIHNLNLSATFLPEYGCYDVDYSAFVEGTVALIARGNCTFAEKVVMAEKYNASAVIIYNEGNTPDRVGLFSGGLGEVSVPVFAAAYGLGIMLKYVPDVALSIYTNTQINYVNTTNVIAETKTGRSDRIIVVGSHLDSVPAGPGINDNGSGTALNLELAIRVAAPQILQSLKNKIRFAWWAAEELGLLGSTFYMNNLNATNQAELANIAVNLNFDMVGSPNYFRGIYNGSSDAKSNGSGVVQQLFTQYFANHGITAEPTAFTGRSDYGPFLAHGKPAGGLFTGAEVKKTRPERGVYGGLANAPYDPCYHEACDTVDNIDRGVFNQMGKAAASVLEQLALADDLHSLLLLN